jgi:hypothetical protein
VNFTYNKLISLGALVALTGFVLSGPVAFLIVHLVSPQPEWVSPMVFVRHYQTIQDLPYYFGFMLTGGMLMLVSGHYLNFSEEDKRTKFHLLVALGWTIAFFTLISFNYICQTTFVHNLATHYSGENDIAISIFSMANPLSFCWANEMWGYAFLGIATVLMSGYYRLKNIFIFVLLLLNGMVSLLGVVLIILDVNWILTRAGLICYIAWNLLMIVLLIMIYIFSKKHENKQGVARQKRHAEKSNL